MVARFSMMFALFIFPLAFYAQSDTTDYEVFDVVYLSKGGALKGEIISFDAATGGLVFKDQLGRIFPLSADEYKFFLEDQVFKTKAKRQKDKAERLKERKQNEWEFNVGLSALLVSLSEQFEPDDYYLSSEGGVDLLPVCITAGAGKYFNRKHFAGISLDIPLSADGSKYFSAGARYAYQYDAARSNLAAFIPVELRVTSLSSEINYSVNDTTFENAQSWTFPTREALDFNMTSVSLGIGQGVGFILPERRSISLELMFIKYFTISHSYTDIYSPVEPRSTLDAVGFRFASYFNF